MAKRIKEGCGIESRGKYKPWMKVQDLGSRGRSSRLKGLPAGR